MDRAQIITLSQVGYHDGAPPLQIEVVPGEMINRAIFLYGTFEISETRLVQAALRPGMTFVDVGANIGYYTLIAARLVGETGAVHCFEPNGDRSSWRNIRRNGFGNVVVHAEAFARETGEVEFYASTWKSRDLLDSAGRVVAGRCRVRSVSFDDFVMGLAGRPVDFFKMDIEGAELHRHRRGTSRARQRPTRRP